MDGRGIAHARGWLVPSLLVLLPMAVAGQSFSVVVDLADAEGREPHARLLDGGDGFWYGTTVAGGAGHGTIIRVRAGQSPQTLYAFDGAAHGSYPEAGLSVGSNGILYGTTRYGGSANKGTVFSFAPATRELRTLRHFTGANGAEPRGELVRGGDGDWYGTTAAGGTKNFGVIFRISSAGAFTVLRSFTGGADGRKPSAGLLLGSDDHFYGTTSSGGTLGFGTVFRFSPPNALTTIVAFAGANGANPMAGLIEGRDGHFYGTTFSGGTAMQGTVFRLTAQGVHTVLGSFTGLNGSLPMSELVQAADDRLYGTASFGGASAKGVIFRLATTGGLTVLRSLSAADGARPDAALVEQANGRLAGVAPSEGPLGAAGTMFEIATDGSFQRTHAFRGSPTHPYGTLTREEGGAVWGTSNAGGASGYGTIFRLSPDAGTLELHHAFALSDGAHPNEGVVEGSDGSLYGTTIKGGAANVGVVYRKTPAGGFSVLASFSSGGAMGYWPYASLTRATDGHLYGVTYAGGSKSAGAIFRVSRDGVVSLRQSFSGGNGRGAYGRLVEGPDGLLYGTTVSGGNTAGGNIFSFDPSSDAITSLHTFSGPDGRNPYAGLTVGTDGRLYGATYSGGAANKGVVFAFDPATRTLTRIHDFTGETGAHPYGALEPGADGQLYGTTSLGGADNVGTVYRVDATHRVALVHAFDGSDGKFPRSALARASNGHLFGTTSDGGASGNGVVYRIATGSAGGGNPPPPPPPPGAVEVEVNAPRNGATWVIGTARVLRWVHDAATGTSARIELSRDGGSSWTLLEAAVANGPGTGEYTWLVDGPATSRARFRVTIGKGGGDTSAIFSIRN